MSKDHRETYQPLAEKIMRVWPSDHELRERGNYPQWFGYALSDIALVLDADEIEHVFASVNDVEGKDYDAVISLFTKDLLVRVERSNRSPSRPQDRDTSVIARNMLKMFVVTAERSATSSEAFTYPPGAVDVFLNYGEQDKYKVSFSRDSEAIESFIQSLRSDLTR